MSVGIKRDFESENDTTGAYMPELEVYIKTGCHLCEALLEELESFRADCDRSGFNFSYRLIDIEDNQADFAKYKEIIPTLRFQGSEICRYFFDQTSLKQALNIQPSD